MLLGISALSLTAGMTLVAAYAIGEFTQRDWLLIPQMTRFHGTANALGFALCGLLGWTLASNQLDDDSRHVIAETRRTL